MQAAAQAFLDDWSGGDTDAAAKATTDPDAATALLEQTADGPAGRRAVGRSSAKVDVEDGDRPPSTGPPPGTSPPPRTGATTPRSTCARATTAGRSSPSRRSCTRSWGRGSTWCSPAACPSAPRSPTPTGAPLFTPTEVVNVGVDPAQVTDLPGAGRRRCRRPPASRPTRSSPTSAGRARRAVRPGDHPAPPRLRGDPRAGVRPARRGLPDRHPAAGARRPASPLALLGRVGAATAEVIEETKDDGDRRGTPPATSWASPGCSGRSRSSSPAPPGFTVTRRRAPTRTPATQGREIASVAPVPGTPVQTPLVPAVQNAADAAVAGAARCPPTWSSSGPAPARSSPSPPTRPPTPGNALTGQFPPGSSMKTMTATALLVRRRASPPTPRWPARGRRSSTGREFENEDQFDLGTVPLHRGVRRSPATRPSSSRR